MKPVAIFRHYKTEGPGYFATFLDQHSIPWQLIAIDREDAVPCSAEAFSGIALMGGPMSVNDPLPWIDQECALIHDARTQDIPVIGHCLGGQLISRAFGGNITRSPAKEIGWSQVQVDDDDCATRWLGDWQGKNGGIATVFQWHGETFSLPPGAKRLFTNDFCANQMFALGPHLAMQCHIEMTPEMIKEWAESWASETTGLDHLPSCIQTPEQMQQEATARLPAMRSLADQLYSVWIGGLKT